VFPSHDAVVAAVPEHDRYPLLDELETSTDVFAAAHPGVEVWQAGATRVGHFANMLAAEPEQSQALADLRAEAEAKVRERAPQLASAGGLEPVPVRALVQCQLAALLCTLVAVRERYRPAHPRPSTARIAL